MAAILWHVRSLFLSHSGSLQYREFAQFARRHLSFPVMQCARYDCPRMILFPFPIQRSQTQPAQNQPIH